MATVPQRKERTSAMRESVTRDIIINDLSCVRMVDGKPEMEYFSIAGKYHPRDFQRQHKDLTVVGVTQRKVFCYMDLQKFYELSEKVTSDTGTEDGQNEYQIPDERKVCYERTLRSHAGSGHRQDDQSQR